MNSQFNVTYTVPAAPPMPADPAAQAAMLADLLRQLLDVQQQQLAQLRATAASQDAGARWRALLTKWREEFPQLPEGCKRALPILERSYGAIIAQMIEEIHEKEETLDNEFTLQDFLDRYGMRLGQMGNIINLVGPLVDAANATQQNEAS